MQKIHEHHFSYLNWSIRIANRRFTDATQRAHEVARLETLTLQELREYVRASQPIATLARFRK